jgi:hypothetical protein
MQMADVSPDALEYVVFKENKYGIKQQRIITVDLEKKTIQVLDAKKRVRKVAHLISPSASFPAPSLAIPHRAMSRISE